MPDAQGLPDLEKLLSLAEGKLPSERVAHFVNALPMVPGCYGLWRLIPFPYRMACASATMLRKLVQKKAEGSLDSESLFTELKATDKLFKGANHHA